MGDETKSSTTGTESRMTLKNAVDRHGIKDSILILFTPLLRWLENMLINPKSPKSRRKRAKDLNVTASSEKASVPEDFACLLGQLRKSYVDAQLTKQVAP